MSKLVIVEDAKPHRRGRVDTQEGPHQIQPPAPRIAQLRLWKIAPKKNYAGLASRKITEQTTAAQERLTSMEKVVEDTTNNQAMVFQQRETVSSFNR